MGDFILAIVLIMVLLTGWVVIQKLARNFAARHPEFGPAKEEGGSCGKGCLCRNGHCVNRQATDPPPTNHQHPINQQGTQHDHSQRL